MHMNILISANAGFYDAAIIMLRSLFYHNKNNKISIYLFHAELDKGQIERLRYLIKKNNGILHAIKIDDEVLKDIPVGNISKETYYRLMAPELLPTELDRVLYLDIDMLVVGDISAVYQADFHDNLFMAAPDTLPEVDQYKKRLHMKKDSVYINAGVLLMNLDLLRKEFDWKEALDYAVKYPERVPSCDQDVINALYHKRIGHLDGNYNYEARFHSIKEIFTYPFRYKNLLEKIKIIHYMGPNKPWKSGFNGKYLRVYSQYARKTSYEKTIRENMRKRYKYIANLFREIAVKEIQKKINEGL